MRNRIILEYSLISLVVTIGIAIVLSNTISARSEQFSMDQHASFFLEYLESIPSNYPELAEALSRGTEPDEHDVDHFLRDLFLFPSIVHIRISRPDGDVLWEQTRQDTQHGSEKLEGLITMSSNEVLIRTIQDDSDSRSILSVFYPLKMEGMAIAYIEAIDIDQQVHQQLLATRRSIERSIILSGFAFYVLLFALFFMSYRRLQQSNRRLEMTQEVTIRTMSRLAELRDNDTGAHIDRTSHYCEILAAELRKNKRYAGYISKAYIADLRRSAPLHDIGKVGIPDSILNKPGPLSSAEWALMRQHPIMGGEVLKRAIEELDFQSYFEIGLQVVLCHHENWDGSGYPDGISGSAIPLSARIMALADVYDALRTARPYKNPMPHEAAVETILEDRARKFDPDVVNAFIAVQEQFLKISG